MGSGEISSFEEAILRVVREAAEPAVASGLATLEEFDDADGDLALLLQPSNADACELRVYPDYPTLCMGPEQVCTEMFGSEEKRLEELPGLVRAVIAGKFEWEHRQAKFLRKRFTELRGTFQTENGPWVFTRRGGEPRGALARRTYPPY